MDAAINALRFHGGSVAGLQAFAAADWPALFRHTDEHAVTLALGTRCGDLLPSEARERIDRNLADNALRHERLIASCREIAAAFEACGVEFVLLKGISRWPDYCADLRFRPSYDIDLYCPEHFLSAALRALQSLGYEGLAVETDEASDHLPRMVRKTGWVWRENYFDPEMPLAVELHHRFWDEKTERFAAGDVDAFFRRRTYREIAGLCLPVLAPLDALAYTALHLVRHLLRGALKLHHVYEVACFLESSARDEAFWLDWQRAGDTGRRTGEAISFRLAAEWFGCVMNPIAAQAVEHLSAHVKTWFEVFGRSHVLITGAGSKNELWLHLCLVDSREDQWHVARRKLFPVRHGGLVLNPYVAANAMTVRLRAANYLFGLRFLATRLAYHAAALVRMLVDGAIWWLALRRQRGRSPDKPHHEKHPV